MSNEVIGIFCYSDSLRISIFTFVFEGRGKTYHFRWERDIGLNRTWNTTNLVLWIKFDDYVSYLAIRKDDIVETSSPEIRMRSRSVRQLDKRVSQRQDKKGDDEDLLEPNLPFGCSITMHILKQINGKHISLLPECLPNSERISLEGHVYQIDSHRLPVPPPGN